LVQAVPVAEVVVVQFQMVEVLAEEVRLPG